MDLINVQVAKTRIKKHKMKVGRTFECFFYKLTLMMILFWMSFLPTVTEN